MRSKIDTRWKTATPRVRKIGVFLQFQKIFSERFSAKQTLDTCRHDAVLIFLQAWCGAHFRQKNTLDPFTHLTRLKCALFCFKNVLFPAIIFPFVYFSHNWCYQNGWSQVDVVCFVCLSNTRQPRDPTHPQLPDVVGEMARYCSLTRNATQLGLLFFCWCLLSWLITSTASESV